MNLYLLKQNINNGYDTFDSVVVCAATAEEARMIHPSEDVKEWDGLEGDPCVSYWVSAKDVEVELIGTAVPGLKKGVVTASYNAG
jgi:hypothetical protein